MPHKKNNGLKNEAFSVLKRFQKSRGVTAGKHSIHLLISLFYRALIDL